LLKQVLLEQIYYPFSNNFLMISGEARARGGREKAKDPGANTEKTFTAVIYALPQ
jgi:hypothetical protein